MPPNNIDAILASNIKERTRQLCLRDEDQWFERKAIEVSQKMLARTLIAFANAEGGTAIVGVKDRSIQDLNRFTKKINELRLTPSAQLCSPPIDCEVKEIATTSQDGASRFVLAFLVTPSGQVHRGTDDSCYLRRGDRSLRLSLDEIRRLEYDRGARQFEAETVRDLTFADLPQKNIVPFLEATGASRGKKHLLRSRSLCDKDGRINNAAYLLFADSPLALLPGAYVRVCRFQGNERLTGESQNIIFDRRTELPIPQAIDQAVQWIEEVIPRRRALGQDGKFADIPVIPQGAWLEGLVNAVIHRAYDLMGDGIRVEIFDNRIEISNPGSFRDRRLAAKAPLEIARYAINPRIARTCCDLGYAQELGEGIKRIFSQMNESGLSNPEYRQEPMHVVLTLRYQPRLAGERTGLSRSATAVLSALQALGGSGGTGDIAQFALLTRPTTRAALKDLKDLGLVSWQGKSVRDPRATWRLK